MDKQPFPFTDISEKNTHTNNVEQRVFMENHICSDNTTPTAARVTSGGATFELWYEYL